MSCKLANVQGPEEAANLHYAGWFKPPAALEACGDTAPAELEAAYYRHNAALAEAG
jgi:hypothetical protein